VAYKDPERTKAYQREYRERHREKAREKAQRWRDENPERSRESRRRYVREHREEVLEENRKRYWANREEAIRQRQLRRQRPGGKTPRERARDEIVTQLWHAQEGCCYLCNKFVALEDAVLEHDHRCCPPGAFCQFCIRGVSHQGCNKILGHAADNPDLLELIAFNLRAKLPEMDQRMASKPSQADLLAEDDCA